MEGSRFDEDRFFDAIHQSGARALLIGRRALIALGIPVLTGDYDFWVHRDDLDIFNAAAAPFGLRPTHTALEAHQSGRYKLENDEKVDVLVARAVGTVDGVRLAFDDAWGRRQVVWYTDRVRVILPSIDDLILTKRFAARSKDGEDIRWLEQLKGREK